ncbi:MAG: hypothetical protein IT350_10645 [Deltaproteobacteria bacterium]|nr:hypothetical protein [Deltaproteobacteria bacterium]
MAAKSRRRKSRGFFSRKDDVVLSYRSAAIIGAVLVVAAIAVWLYLAFT